MRKFILTAFKTNKDCFLKDSTEPGVEIFCKGFKDLQDTIKCIHGGRMRSSRWYSKYLQPQYLHNNSLVLQDGLLQTKIFEIKEISHDPELLHTKQITNSKGFTHSIKVIKTQNEK